MRRLRVEDEAKIRAGEAPAWVDLYTRIQQDRFEPVLPNEADRILLYDSENGQPEHLKIV
ncbi:MAG: hypothetical protein HYY50_05630 [Candidatus Kerfeldbacteria bacterium]|nr:hypothetical protein [Candidatus Kerfeldbacteria bacterium]